MSPPLSLRDTLLKASLLCGLRPNEGVAHRLQLFFTANAILKSKSGQSNFQRSLETGVDQDGFWGNYGKKGSGDYFLTESGYRAAIKRFGKVGPIFPPTDGSNIHFQIEGALDGLSFRMETTGKTSTVYLNGELIKSAKRACELLQKIDGINLPTLGESAPRVLYNFAVERGFSFIWQGKQFKNQDGLKNSHDESTTLNTEPTDISGPQRQSVMIDRIIRDTEISKKIKELHNCQCQICGESLELADNKFYAEAHHIKPLGSLHNGPDIAANLICVCPKHHVLLDYGAIDLNIKEIAISDDHQIAEEYITYHNDKIWGKYPFHKKC